MTIWVVEMKCCKVWEPGGEIRFTEEAAKSLKRKEEIKFPSDMFRIAKYQRVEVQP